MKILFINSVCTRNGSTLLLLNFLEWLKKEHPEIQFDIMSKLGGSLENEFDLVSDVHYKLYKKKKLIPRIIRAGLRKIGVYKLNNEAIYDYEVKRLSKRNYDIIYNNTIFNLELSVMIKEKCSIPKLVLHNHELQNFILSVYPDFQNFFPSIDLFICASETVKNNLTTNWNVTQSEVVYAFSKLDNSICSKELPSKNFVISGSGRGAKRKGLDLFINTCAIISQIAQELNIRFQWLGHLTEEERSIHQEIVNKKGLQVSFSFLEERPDTREFYEQTTVFIMSSREDPFPLVCIEAGSFGIPICLFDGATGTQEVFNDLKYLIAPQFNTEALASNVVDLLKDKELYMNTSKIMNERFKVFNVENQSKQIYDLLLNKI